MPGAPDPLYVNAREVLLDALEALGAHRASLILVGAQAIYFQLAERAEEPGRTKDKDALDLFRLLRGIDVDTLVCAIDGLRNDQRSGAVTNEALQYLERLFGRPESLGSMLAARAAEGLEPAETIKQSCAVLATDLLSALRRS